MNPFEVDRNHVRLRSHARFLYLHADEDGRGVSHRPQRGSQNVAWIVHVIPGAEYVILQSAAYGRYLSATRTPGRLGHRGFRTELRPLTISDHPVAANDLRWRPVMLEIGNTFTIGNVSPQGTCYLRANGRHLKSHMGVTVEDREPISDMLRWVVQPIPVTNMMLPPRHPNPPPRGVLRPLLRRIVGVQGELERTIRYVLAEPNGEFNDNNWVEFRFAGRSLKKLWDDLSRLMNQGRQRPYRGFGLCARCGPHAHPCPMHVDLPINQDTIDIIVFLYGSPGYEALRHPLVD